MPLLGHHYETIQSPSSSFYVWLFLYVRGDSLRFFSDQPPNRDLKVSDLKVRDLTLTELHLSPSSMLLLRFEDESLNSGNCLRLHKLFVSHHLLQVLMFLHHYYLQSWLKPSISHPLQALMPVQNNNHLDQARNRPRQILKRPRRRFRNGLKSD
jgi:hypothetical protein